MEKIEMNAGDSCLTRRVLKRCKEAGFEVTRNYEFQEYGRRKRYMHVVSYTVLKTVYEEEAARRDRELEERKAAWERTEEKARVDRLAKRLTELSERFPLIDRSTLERLTAENRKLYGPEEVGYQHNVGTEDYWKSLGFLVSGQPCGHLVVGDQLVEVFGANSIQPLESDMTVDSLEELWLEKYGSPELTVAMAMKFANRLQKVKPQADFYPLKDKWLRANQDKLVEGAVTRIESRPCWSCDGTGVVGDEDDEDECYRCDGTGVYSSRALYEHQLLIEGTRFSFHSYYKPTKVTEKAATEERNRSPFGRPFTPDELPVPPQQLLIELINRSMDKSVEGVSSASCEEILFDSSSWS